ncbi:hypothetical protein JOF56_003032 [Kibdelosporangium banguiense]|uniref:WYL domain-containing protein n=1 Tax=Kibdelosporangium banguiense TaxID=1365924 RepID=A0ABS4TE09_9PSEU|nr:hypothetical protein [Kibdelosporangium banguiense]MBP2322647.1 hypothetical protein [Kibdelosporangium banguiense]
MPSLSRQLYKAKLQLAAVFLMIAGIVVRALATAIESTSWLPTWAADFLPDIGTSLFVAGLVGIYLDYRTRKESEALLSEQLERAIENKAPAIRDALLSSFAFKPDDLKNIASDDTLDRIATNALALRLGDQALAHDLYTDLRDQVIRSPERWHDVDIDVSLSPWAAGPKAGLVSMFVATVRWEYKVVTTGSTVRFACVADEREYRELLRDPTVASAWHFDESSKVDAASPEAFELLRLSVDGHEKKVHRSQHRGAQSYRVDLGDTAANDQPVTIAYTYRVLVLRHGHVLYLDLPRPTKGVHVRLTYADAGIRRVNILDYFAGSQASRIEQAPSDVPTKTVDVGFDGWIFPRSGVAFVWVLQEEQRRHDA